MSQEELTDMGVDTAEAELQLKQLRAHAAMTETALLTTVKRLWRITSLTAQLIGWTIPLFFSLVAEAGFMAAAMFSELAKAEAITGWLAFKAVLTFAVAGALFYRAMKAKEAEHWAESKLNTAILLTDNLAAL